MFWLTSAKKPEKNLTCFQRKTFFTRTHFFLSRPLSIIEVKQDQQASQDFYDGHNICENS